MEKKQIKKQEQTIREVDVIDTDNWISNDYTQYTQNKNKNNGEVYK
jgi:hypothetical protein